MSSDFSNMIGKILDSVHLSDDKTIVTFSFEDKSLRSFSAEGDCCSRSWIEHLELPGDINGAVLLAVESSEPLCGEDETQEKLGRDSCLQVYSISFHTNRGDIVLEFRNLSNGCYGGYLVDERTVSASSLS